MDVEANLCPGDRVVAVCEIAGTDGPLVFAGAVGVVVSADQGLFSVRFRDGRTIDYLGELDIIRLPSGLRT